MTSNRQTIVNLYLGILNNYSDFSEETDARLSYDFAAEGLKELKTRYNLGRIAKSGTSFEKAVRLLRHFSPRLTHDSFFDNHVECNALELLSYSFDKKERGINCLNKAKILAECCLALDIYARRVFINPFSPFDFDSHVVCEIFDEKTDKWIMLDPTTNGYFVDENLTPLSAVEIRNNFIAARFQTFVSSSGRGKDLQKTKLRNDDVNFYFLKNCFRLSFEEYNGFGKKSGSVCLVPKNYSVTKNEELNRKFRIENTPKEYLHFLAAQEKYLSETNHASEPTGFTVKSLYSSPIDETRLSE